MQRFLLISILSVLVATGLAGCGSNSKLIPADTADALIADLDQISSDVADGNCEDASAQLADAKSRAEALPPTTDEKLKQRLNSGLSALGSQIDSQCEPSTDTTTDETPTTTTKTTSTETNTTPTDTETVPTNTETVPTQTVPTETTPTETTPTETVVPTGPNGGTPPTGPSDPGGDTVPVGPGGE